MPHPHHDKQLADHVLDYITGALDAHIDGSPAPARPTKMTEAEAHFADWVIADITATPPAAVYIPPLAEDPIAVRLGIVPPPAPVPVDTAAAAEALTGADIDSLRADLAHYWHPVTGDWLRGLATGAVTEACPITLRILAVLCGVATLRGDADNDGDCAADTQR